ncbi:HAMP domain-containing sensor histidine kinase [Granulosicoccaceae sp. 1_MG-2023]|nr:HAMP domain-containing sensor histidine kinase [Granulosicoccaceae sp. 1_MG-2023]
MSKTKAQHNAFRRTLLKGVTLLGAALGLLLVLFISRAENGMEVISLHHWLDAEVNQYLRDYAHDPASVRVPNPYEFDTYRSTERVPEWLKPYDQPGFYEHLLGTEDKHFRVVTHPSGQGLLYVVFKNDADDYLDQYETRLHWLSVSMALVTWLLTSVGALLLIGRLAKPLQRVLDKINSMAPSAADFAVDAPYDELRRIESALLNSKQQIRRYFRREQEFSRFASHEIRTPLMVMRGSVDILNRLELPQPAAQRAVGRIDDACREMTLLTELFLMLGRDSIESRHFETLPMAKLVDATIARLEQAGRTIEVDIVPGLSVDAPPALVKVLLRNLLRNALMHGGGDIHLAMTNEGFSVSNPLAEPGHDAGGYGYGLIIVERICERLGWHLGTAREDGQFVATVTFKASQEAA